MTSWGRIRRWLLYAGATLAIFVTTAAAVAVFYGSKPPEAAALTLGNGLLVNTRDRLQVCVDGSPALTAAERDTALAAVADGLASVRSHRDWEPAGFGSAVPRPQRGCPGGFPLKPTRVEKGRPFGLGRTTSPSPYRTAVFVVDDESAAVVLGQRDVALAPFEILCPSDHQCAEVTTALVVRKGFLTEPEFHQWLTLAIGLEPTDGLHGRVPKPADSEVSK